jgi:GxxExxY protein
MKEYKALSIEEERIGKLIVNASFKVHKELGPGLLERIYEACLEYELKSVRLDVERQLKIPIKYAGQTFDEGLRLDLLVQGKVVIEIKAVEEMNEVWQAPGHKSFETNTITFRLSHKLQRASHQIWHPPIYCLKIDSKKLRVLVPLWP